MGRRIRNLLLFLWRMLYPLLIYQAVVTVTAAVCMAAVMLWGSWDTGGRMAPEVQEELSRQLSVPVTALGALLAAIPLGLLYIWSRWEQDAEDDGVSDRQPVRLGTIRQLLVLGAALCVAGNGALMSLPFLWDSFEETGELLYAPPLMLQIICIGLVIPVAEELVFRGLAYRSMRKSVPVWAAMVISALYFGIYHGNLVQGIYAVMIGLAEAWVMEHYDALTASVVVHVSANVMSLLIANTMFGAIMNVFAAGRWALVLICSGISVCIFNKIRKDRNNYEASVDCDSMLQL